MTASAPAEQFASASFDPLDDSIERAQYALLALGKSDGHWCFELEADCTIPAEYVLMRHYRDEPVDAVLEGKIGNYLRRLQGGTTRRNISSCYVLQCWHSRCRVP